MKNHLYKIFKVVGLAIFIFIIAFSYLSQQNKKTREDFDYKLSKINDYDYFYNDCIEYFNNKKLIIDTEKTCNELMKISNDSTKEIITDIYNNVPDSEKPSGSDYSAYYGWN